MPAEILPATIEDAPQIFDIYRKAFASDTVSALIFQNMDVEDAYRRFARTFHEYDVFKLEEFSEEDVASGKGSKKIVAFAVWKFVSDPAAEKEHATKAAAEREKKKGTPEQESPYVAGVNKALFDAFIKGVIKGLRMLVMDQKCAILHLLAVLPGHQRYGYGGRLVRHGLSLAKQRHLPIAWLEGTPIGMPLYKRLGFEVVEVKSLDLAPYGANELAHSYGMKKVLDESDDAKGTQS